MTMATLEFTKLELVFEFELGRIRGKVRGKVKVELG